MGGLLKRLAWASAFSGSGTLSGGQINLSDFQLGSFYKPGALVEGRINLSAFVCGTDCGGVRKKVCETELG